MPRKCRAIIEGPSLVILLVYSPGHNVGLMLKYRLHISPARAVAGGKPGALTRAPEIEMFFIRHGYLMPLCCKRHSCSMLTLTPFLVGEYM